MDLREVTVVVVRHWVLLVGGVLLGLAAAVVTVLVSTPEYEARAQVVFAAHNAADGQDLAFAGEYVQNRLHTYREMTLSPGVLEDVAAELGSGATAAGLADRTDVEVNQLTTVVDIVVSHPDAEQATQEADAVASAMIEAVSALEDTGTDDATAAVQVTAQVLSDARRPDEPSSPDTLFLVLAGLVGGLVAGAAAVAVRHALRRDPG